MKKIYIVLIMVFICGVLAITIPKNASAEEFPNQYENEYSFYDLTHNYTSLTGCQFINGSAYSTDRLYYVSSTNLTYDYKYTNSLGIYFDNITISFDIVDAEIMGNPYNVTYTFDEIIPTYITYENVVDYNGDRFLEYSIVINAYWSNNNWYDLEIDVDVSYNYTLPNAVKLSVSIPIEYEFYNPPYVQDSYYTYAENVSPVALSYAYMISNGLIEVEYKTDLTDFDFIQYIKDTTSTFLDAELIGSLSIGDILLFVVSIGLLVFILRFFAGG